MKCGEYFWFLVNECYIHSPSPARLHHSVQMYRSVSESKERSQQQTANEHYELMSQFVFSQ